MELIRQGVVDIDIFLDPRFLVLPPNLVLFLPPVDADVGTVKMYHMFLASAYPEDLYYTQSPLLHISHYPLLIRQRISGKFPLRGSLIQAGRDQDSGYGGESAHQGPPATDSTALHATVKRGSSKSSSSADGRSEQSAGKGSGWAPSAPGLGAPTEDTAAGLLDSAAPVPLSEKIPNAVVRMRSPRPWSLRSGFHVLGLDVVSLSLHIYFFIFRFSDSWVLSRGLRLVYISEA